MNRAPQVLAAFLIASLAFVSSCEEKETIVYVPREVPADCPPSAPRGVYAVNLDGYISICWYPNPEDDIVGYDIWKNDELYGVYEWIGTVDREDPDPFQYCFDYTTPYNQQYFYAVSAYDEADNLSDLSYEEVTATPRPEGFLRLQDRDSNPSTSGYDFSTLSNIAQGWDLASTDIWFDGGAANIFYTDMPRVMIQDYGYVAGFDDINYAPIEGFSPIGSVEVIENHVYMLKIGEADGDHYVKLWIYEVTPTYADFWWAYQTDPYNRDLMPGIGAGDSDNAAIPADGEPAGVKRIQGVPNGRRVPPTSKSGNLYEEDFLQRQNTLP